MEARRLLWGALLCGAASLAPLSEAQAQADVNFSALPEDGRDAADRLIFQFEGRYDSTLNQTSGDPAPQGELYPGDSLRTGANYLLGDVRLGTRRLLLPTLNTYVMGSGGLDIDGQPTLTTQEEAQSQGATEHRYLQQPYGDNAFFLQSAYAELDGFARTGALKNLSLRAGRQYHWGVGATSFDGATLGYEDGALNVNARFGQRAAIYNLTQDDPGLVGGLDVTYNFMPALNVPLLLKGEYVFFSRDVRLTPRDAVTFGADEQEVTVNLGELSAYVDVSDDLLLSARLKVTDAALSRASLGLRWALGDAALLIVDLNQKIGQDLFFDLAGGSVQQVTNPATGIERDTTYESYRLNIVDLQPFSEIQARLPLELSEWLSVQPEVGGRLSLGDAEALGPYDASFVNWALGASLRQQIDKQSGLELDLQYRGRAFDRSNIYEEEDVNGLFSDVGAGPEVMSNEVSGQINYTRGQRFVAGRLLGDRSLSLGLGGFYKAYVLRSRRILADSVASDNDEALVGVNAQVKWWATTYTNLGLRYEYAKDSNVFVPHLSDFQLLQGTFTAQF
jgi:hypothetical protein